MKTFDWIIIGGLTGLVGQELIRNPPKPPRWLVKVIDAYNAEVLRRKQQLQLAELQARLQKIAISEFKPLMLDFSGVFPPVLAEQNIAPSLQGYIPPVDDVLARLVRHPSVILILGHRGSGKTALAVRLQELLQDVATPYRAYRK